MTLQPRLCPTIGARLAVIFLVLAAGKCLGEMTSRTRAGHGFKCPRMRCRLSVVSTIALLLRSSERGRCYHNPLVASLKPYGHHARQRSRSRRATVCEPCQGHHEWNTAFARTPSNDVCKGIHGRIRSLGSMHLYKLIMQEIGQLDHITNEHIKFSSLFR